MKKIKLNITLAGALLCVLLTIIGTVVVAQNTPGQRSADSAAAKLSTNLSVSKEKTTEILNAYKTNQTEIQRLMMDKTLTPMQKHDQMKQLMAQRNEKINSAMTNSQKQQLIGASSPTNSKMRQWRTAMKQRHQHQIDNMRSKSPFLQGQHEAEPKTIPTTKQR